MLAPAGAFSSPPPSPSPPAVFFTAAAVPALAGTFSIFHCRSSACSSRILLYFSPTAPAATAPAGAPPVSPNYRSSVRSRRSSLSIFHCRSSDLLPQERYPYFLTTAVVNAPLRSATLYFLTAPAVSAPAGALPIFPHCRSSARSSRSLFPQPPPPPPPPPHLLVGCDTDSFSRWSHGVLVEVVT